MSLSSGVGLRLSMFKATEDKVLVTMKSKRFEPFVAYVIAFKFDGEDTNVTFQKCPETIFPDDTESKKNDTFTTYIKNVKEVTLVE